MPDKPEKPKYLSRAETRIVIDALAHAMSGKCYVGGDHVVAQDLFIDLQCGKLHLLSTSEPRPTPIKWAHGSHDPMRGPDPAIPETQCHASWSDAVEALLDDMAATSQAKDVTMLAKHRRQAHEFLKEDQEGWFAYGDRVWWVRKLVMGDD